MKFNSEAALEWSEKLKQQLLSNKSAASWCKEQGISYSTFQYWRKRFNKKDTVGVHKNSFVELPQEPFSGLIDILLPGAKISISTNFDREALLFCLKLLGGR